MLMTHEVNQYLRPSVQHAELFPPTPVLPSVVLLGAESGEGTEIEEVEEQ